MKPIFRVIQVSWINQSLLADLTASRPDARDELKVDSL